MHKPIQLHKLELSFPHKICFEAFATHIRYGSRIAIIGRNGSGKSTLLKILQGTFEATRGEVSIPLDVVFGYVPQVINEWEELSGGQRLMEVLMTELGRESNVLLLDEPTNHLDRKNRKRLMRVLKNYPGTLIVVSHDLEILRQCVDTFWHIDNGKIHLFSGNYDNYIREMKIKRMAIEEELSRLNRQKKASHQVLMKEQERAKKSNVRGAKSIRERKWPTIVSDEKARRAIETGGKKKKAIQDQKDKLLHQLSGLRLPEEIVPKFSLKGSEVGNRTLVSISDGSIAYDAASAILSSINLSLAPCQRLAIKGDNGSGKSTLVKAILEEEAVRKKGYWQLLSRNDIGYLDQHYTNLGLEKTVLESVSDLVTGWSHADLRCHLNDFLFRKNEEVNLLVHQLSGGEKARLSLAQIAAKTPTLLILDEITNNLDLETRHHVTAVLKAYPGAMIVISHDEDFLQEIKVTEYYHIENRILQRGL